jgi:hypothetical protein
MEENRLTQMPEDYNKNLFNEIYKNVQGLKHKIASEIDHNRFGVERDDILSWLDIKFIFVFNKYSNRLDPDTLKGFIINSLKQYKNRILRVSYQSKYINNPIDIADVYEYRNIVTTEDDDSYSIFLSLASAYMEKNLSKDAFEVFQLELYPPPFILKKLMVYNPTAESINKIPPQILADYLGLGTSAKAADYIQSLRAEIKGAITKAKAYFREKEKAGELIF